MNAQDMMPFCSDDENRPYLMAPFSRGKYTYATNGHILLRVPRIPDVGEHPMAPSCEKVIEPVPELPLAPLPYIEIPAQETAECYECDGANPVHDCPHCSCTCEACDGTNEVEIQLSMDICGAIFDTKYIRLIQELPGVKFPVEPSKREPNRFSFDGGDGIIMPMTCRGDKHMEEDGTVIEIIDGEN